MPIRGRGRKADHPGLMPWTLRSCVGSGASAQCIPSPTESVATVATKRRRTERAGVATSLSKQKQWIPAGLAERLPWPETADTAFGAGHARQGIEGQGSGRQTCQNPKIFASKIPSSITIGSYARKLLSQAATWEPVQQLANQLPARYSTLSQFNVCGGHPA